MSNETEWGDRGRLFTLGARKKELVMKIAGLCLIIFISAPAPASAETGGYPASPSHGVVGTKPDGTPRYGNERGTDADRSSSTVGSSDSSANSAKPGSPSGDAAKQQQEPPQRDH
jgi:hypothetical protein